VEDNLLLTQGNTYKTLIIPGSKYIPIETFSQILTLASKGAKIIIYGDFPENVAGWAYIESRTDDFRKMKEGLIFKPSKIETASEAMIGNGKIIMGSDLNTLLVYAGIRREQMADKGIKFVRRESKSGNYYFINNQSDTSFEGWLPLSVKATAAALYNPMTEKIGIAQKRLSGDGTLELYMKLNAGESMIIETSAEKVKGKPYLYFDPSSDPVEISGTWKVDFVTGGPTLPESKEVSEVISWTDFGGDDVKNFSGTAKYTISFNNPAGKADAYSLNLGKVFNSVKVTLNGKELGTLIGPDFIIEFDKSLIKSVNILELKVSNLMANRIAYLDRNKIEWKKFYNINMAARLKENNKNGIFDASEWKPRESGLIGPVTITQLKSDYHD
jgi:hypothetical protein